jgi:hypothetical protein
MIKRPRLAGLKEPYELPHSRSVQACVLDAGLFFGLQLCRAELRNALLKRSRIFPEHTFAARNRHALAAGDGQNAPAQRAVLRRAAVPAPAQNTGAQSGEIIRMPCQNAERSAVIAGADGLNALLIDEYLNRRCDGQM